MAKRKTKSAVINRPGRFNYDGLDRVLHEKARLGLVTCLSGTAEGLTFNELKELCDLTDGNLNRHLKQLVDAGLVELHQVASARRRQTSCQLTDFGRQRFIEYVAELQKVVGDAQQQIRSPVSASTPRLAGS